MHETKLKAEEEFDISSLSTSSLNDLYDQTIESLRICSRVVQSDAETDRIEFSLLDREVSVLDMASRVPLKSTENINDLIDIWAKASGVNQGDDIRQTDKIVMNILRHISGRLGQGT